MRPDIFKQSWLGHSGGMDAIGLHHTGLRRYPFQKKRYQCGVMLLRQFGEQVAEPLGVTLAIIGWQLDTNQQHLGLSALGGHDKGIEVGAYFGKRQSAQTIVAPQFHDDHSRSMARNGCGQAFATTQRRVAADAGVDDAVPVTLFAQALLQQRRPSMGIINAIASAQAVTQDQDRRRGAQWTGQY